MFSAEMVIAQLEYSISYVSGILHQFTMLKLLDCTPNEDNTYSYQLNVDTSASKLNAALGSEEISAMADWLEKFAGIDAADIDVSDTEALVKLWHLNI